MKFGTSKALIISCLILTGCKQELSPPRDWQADPKGHIRIAAAEDPHTLDPRFARDLISINAIMNLYEGLLRKTEGSTPTPAVAESYTESDNGLTYTFKLRNAKWSNGDAITAAHFADAWRSQLLPDSKAPNANQLYVLKNGRAVREGNLPPESLGVETPDAHTLIVKLEAPCPYFKKLLCSHFFLPVHPKSTPEALISNGPFTLDSWKKNNELTAAKNENYWDLSHVALNKFSFIHVDEHTALQLYEADQLDWAGSPLSLIPQDAMLSLKKRQHLFTAPAAGIYWFRVNTTKSPLSNNNLRLALAYAIDRSALVKNIAQGNQEAALAIVPPSLGLGNREYFSDANTTKAWELFQIALKELNLTIEDFPKLTVLYSTGSERNQKLVQAIQQQWKKVFGDKIELQGNEAKSVYQQLSLLKYDIALGSWFADVDDPSNFLDMFTDPSNGVNNTGWESKSYAKWMKKSLSAKTEEQRNDLLIKAEGLLMQEMPVIPLFFATFNYVQKKDVNGVILSDLGHLDLKHSFIDIGDAEELEELN